MSTVLLVVLILLISAIHAWPFSQSWGYGPSEILGDGPADCVDPCSSRKKLIRSLG
jgi:hypothetical protein